MKSGEDRGVPFNQAAAVCLRCNRPFRYIRRASQQRDHKRVQCDSCMIIVGIEHRRKTVLVAKDARPRESVEAYIDRKENEKWNLLTDSAP